MSILALLDWPLFVSTFGLIFVAELPDKTAFATLLLASRGKPWPIFVGVALAFTVQAAIAVCLGSLFGLFPERWVHLFAALLFFVFGILEWRKSLSKEHEEEEAAIAGKEMGGFWRTCLSAFLVIFAAEWGDLTQLATASLAARTPSPLTIFLAAVLALWCVTGIAIVLGHYAKRFLNQQRLKQVAAVVFFLVGAYYILKDFGAR